MIADDKILNAAIRIYGDYSGLPIHVEGMIAAIEAVVVAETTSDARSFLAISRPAFVETRVTARKIGVAKMLAKNDVAGQNYRDARERKQRIAPSLTTLLRT